MSEASDSGPASAASVDEFASQKNNIRDTAKWMASAYAAVAAVVVAGAPFSGLGLLPGRLLAIALVAGGISITCILLAINSILKVLIGDYCFAGTLDKGAKDFINKHAGDILPIQFATLEQFLAHREKLRSNVVDLWDKLTRDDVQPLTPSALAEIGDEYRTYLERSDETEKNTARVVSLAHLYLLRNRLDKIRWFLAAMTAIAVVSLIVAVWAATSVKKPKAEICAITAACSAT